MLMRTNGPTEPGVVRECHQHAGVLRALAHRIAISDFVTNAYGGLHLLTVQRQHNVILLSGSARRIGHRQIEKLDESTQPFLQWHIIAKGH